MLGFWNASILLGSAIGISIGGLIVAVLFFIGSFYYGHDRAKVAKVRPEIERQSLSRCTSRLIHTRPKEYRKEVFDRDLDPDPAGES